MSDREAAIAQAEAMDAESRALEANADAIINSSDMRTGAVPHDPADDVLLEGAPELGGAPQDGDPYVDPEEVQEPVEEAEAPEEAAEPETPAQPAVEPQDPYAWTRDPQQLRAYMADVDKALGIVRPQSHEEFEAQQLARIELAMENNDPQGLRDAWRSEITREYSQLVEVAMQHSAEKIEANNRALALQGWTRVLLERHPDLDPIQDEVGEFLLMNMAAYDPDGDKLFGMKTRAKEDCLKIQDRLASDFRSKRQERMTKMGVTRPAAPQPLATSKKTAVGSRPEVKLRPGDPGYRPDSLTAALKHRKEIKRQAAKERGW